MDLLFGLASNALTNAFVLLTTPADNSLVAMSLPLSLSTICTVAEPSPAPAGCWPRGGGRRPPPPAPSGCLRRAPGLHRVAPGAPRGLGRAVARVCGAFAAARGSPRGDPTVPWGC